MRQKRSESVRQRRIALFKSDHHHHKIITLCEAHILWEEKIVRDIKHRPGERKVGGRGGEREVGGATFAYLQSI